MSDIPEKPEPRSAEFLTQIANQQDEIDRLTAELNQRLEIIREQENIIERWGKELI